MRIRQINNNIITQVILILLLALLIYVSIANLKYFVPGFLGAITLYILFRKTYNRLTKEKRWNKAFASIFLMIVSMVVIAIPMWVLIEFMIPELEGFLKDRQQIVSKFNQVRKYMQEQPILNKIDLSEEGLMKVLQRVTAFIPSILNSVAAVLVNIIVALFVLYFMQVNSDAMEKRISLGLPFSDKSKEEMWAETQMMVRSNAIGIPLLGLCQGIVAIIGYLIFGVNNAVLWGLITGVCTILPMVGTMVVWVPICLVLIAGGEVGNGLGLALYCFIIVGGIDNVLRFTILKKLGDVPPLITVFGVLLGLNLFGMMGLIFGPLILSYIGVLYNVYRNEFGRRKQLALEIEQKEEPPNPDAH